MLCYQAVGFHYAHTALHKVEMAIGAETDPSEILNDLIKCVRKVGGPTRSIVKFELFTRNLPT